MISKRRPEEFRSFMRFRTSSIRAMRALSDSALWSSCASHCPVVCSNRVTETSFEPLSSHVCPANCARDRRVRGLLFIL
jgi:hypothetical protein